MPNWDVKEYERKARKCYYFAAAMARLTEAACSTRAALTGASIAESLAEGRADFRYIQYVDSEFARWSLYRELNPADLIARTIVSMGPVGAMVEHVTKLALDLLEHQHEFVRSYRTCVRLDDDSTQSVWGFDAGRDAEELISEIRNDRYWGRLPILADALEEAGCTDSAMLAHFRGPGPHTLGCWEVIGRFTPGVIGASYPREKHG